MPTDKLQILTPIVTSVNNQTGDVTVATKTSELTNDSDFATTTYVDTKVANLVDSAPETLDTLNELSAALGNDPNFATTVANQIGGKVDKVEGKGLSTNDLTATLKSNYDVAYTHSTSTHAPTNAEKNVIIGIQKNGTDVNVNSTTRKVNITVPTSASDVGAVPTSRTINGKELSSNITLSASDVDALPSSTAIITYDSLLPIESTTLIDADTFDGHDPDYFATATDVNDLQSNISNKLSKSGGTMTGELVAQNNSNYTVAQVRNIFISTTEPSGGGNGDIWLQYSE